MSRSLFQLPREGFQLRRDANAAEQAGVAISIAGTGVVNRGYDRIQLDRVFPRSDRQFAMTGLRTEGHLVGHSQGREIRSEALVQMGYKGDNPREADINTTSLRQLDAIITGVRAYNANGG